MSYTHKPNFGSLFKNDKKEKDTQPDYRGNICLPDGSIMELAGWKKTGNGGDSFLSLKLSEPREKKAEASGKIPF